MAERRKHDRVQKEIRFHCYIDGIRFDSASVNISQGGAFLRTKDPIPTDSVVVAVPRQQYLKDYPVMLVGKVLRRQKNSDQGLGLEWMRCVTTSGFRRLWQFIENFPELWETIPPMPPQDYLRQPCVGFDFLTGQFFLPKGRSVSKPNGQKNPARPTAELRPPAPTPAAAEPASAPVNEPADSATTVPVGEARVDPNYAGRSASAGGHEMTTVYSSSQSHPPEVVMPMATTEFNIRLRETKAQEPTPIPMPGPETSERLENPPEYRRTKSSGAITQSIEKRKEEFATNIPVSIELAERTYVARIRMLSLDSVFVISFDHELFEAEQMEVKLPVSLHQRTFLINLKCEVLRTGQHVEAGGPGIHLGIKTVEQPGRPGIFERYVKFLYYQNVSGK